jgi:hypothetical protein
MNNWVEPGWNSKKTNYIINQGYKNYREPFANSGDSTTLIQTEASELFSAYCGPNGTLNPATSQEGYDELSFIYNSTQGTVETKRNAVSDHIKNAYDTANNVNLDINKTDTDGGRKTSFDKCYGVIIDGLDNNRFDLFGSTVWPTPERKEKASFSQSLYESKSYPWTLPGFDYEAMKNSSDLRIVVKENDISDPGIIRNIFCNFWFVSQSRLKFSRANKSLNLINPFKFTNTIAKSFAKALILPRKAKVGSGETQKGYAANK